MYDIKNCETFLPYDQINNNWWSEFIFWTKKNVQGKTDFNYFNPPS